MRIRVTLDPDHGQNDDRRGFVRPVSTAEAHNASVLREFDNITHQPLSSAAGNGTFCPDARNPASPGLSGMQG
jgi:hypothetical protein